MPEQLKLFDDKKFATQLEFPSGTGVVSNNASKESKAAAASVSVRGDCRRVFQEIKNATAGMTCDEVEVALGMTHQTASARVNQLMNSGHIVRLGDITRPTRSGRSAAVWFENPEAAL